MPPTLQIHAILLTRNVVLHVACGKAVSVSSALGPAHAPSERHELDRLANCAGALYKSPVTITVIVVSLSSEAAAANRHNQPGTEGGGKGRHGSAASL